jgi:hypothetical protein
VPTPRPARPRATGSSNPGRPTQVRPTPRQPPSAPQPLQAQATRARGR